MLGSMKTEYLLVDNEVHYWNTEFVKAKFKEYFVDPTNKVVAVEKVADIPIYKSDYAMAYYKVHHGVVRGKAMKAEKIYEMIKGDYYKEK